MGAESTPGKNTTPVAVERGPHIDGGPLTRRSALLRRRFFELNSAVAEIEILSGADEEPARRRLSTTMEEFGGLSLDEQKDRYNRLKEELERNAMRGAFVSAFDAYSDVARDSTNGPVDDLINLETAQRKEEFDQSPLASRVLLIARLKIETQDMLVDKFPHYLKLWEDVLISNGGTEDKVGEDIVALKNRFETASVRGKAGISRDLRERIVTADLTRFRSFLEIYRQLFSKRVIPKNSSDFPSAETWENMFKGVDLNRKVQILHMLESKTYLLLTRES